MIPSPSTPTPYPSPLAHLADCIARIDDLVAAHLARAPQQQSRRNAAIDREQLLVRSEMRGRADVPVEATKLWDAADARLAHVRAREALTLAEDTPLPLVQMAEKFGLSQLEADLLLLVAAPQIDPRYQEDWSAIDPTVTQPNVRAAIAIMSRSFEAGVAMRQIFSRNAPLVGHSLILLGGRSEGSESDYLDLQLEVPRRVVSELLGDAALDETLMGFSRLHTPAVSLAQVVLPPETKELVLSLVKHHDRYLERRHAWGVDDVVTYGKGLVLLFSGSPGTGKTMLANAVAHEVKRRLFSIDASKLTQCGHTIEANLDGVFREARLLDAVLFFDECEQIFLSRTYGNSAMAMLLTRIEQFDGIAILATNMPEVLDEALARRVVATVRFEAPTASARVDIWRRHLPAAMPLAADVDVDRLGTDYELTGGRIKNAVLAALVRCVARDAREVAMADLEHGARLQVRNEAGTSLALVRPEASLDDLVLGRELRARIDDFVAAARVRGTVLTEWGFGKSLMRGASLTALFAGPPGTGKSATAEAIATALERPLFRCSLASVVSKWVGETTKNLEQVFKTAREQRAVLVFDEAEALFGRRVEVTTANDRFVNAETAALLTQLERHDGVVILTTNLGHALDPAFERRIGLRATFRAPDVRERAAIWKALLPADAPLAADVNVGELARLYELTGAQVRNALVAAALKAATRAPGERRITQAMLQAAAMSEAGGVVSTTGEAAARGAAGAKGDWS